MKCVMCENPKDLKRKMITMKYKESGLTNVTLHRVEMFKCNRCGEEYFSFGDQEKLHSLIAEALIQKRNRFSCYEVRFLRTYLGYSSTLFAKLTGYTKETLSRFENGKQNINKTYDIIMRSLVANKLPPDRNYDWHDRWLNEDGKNFSRIDLTQNSKEGWHLKLAA